MEPGAKGSRLPLAIPPGSLFLSASNDIKIRA